MNSTFKNLTFSEDYSGDYSIFWVVTDQFTKFSADGIYFSNMVSLTAIARLDLFSTLNTVDNMYFNNCKAINSRAVLIIARGGSFRNIHFNNLIAIDSSTINHVIDFRYTETKVSTIENWSIKNSTFENFKSVLSLSAPTGSVEVNGIAFENVTLNKKVSVILIRTALFMNIKDLKITHIHQGSEKDLSNKIIDLSDLISTKDSTINIENVKVEDSSIPLMEIANPSQPMTVSQVVSMSNLVYKNSVFQSKEGIIRTSNVSSSSKFAIIFTHFTFQDITFIMPGYLMHLGHQCAEQLLLTNVVITNVTQGQIAMKSYTPKKEAHKTRVKISNLLAHDNNVYLFSLLYISRGTSLEIHNSTFYNIANVFSGSVLYAGSQQAEADIYNSRFYNNTSIEGGVFTSERKSVIR